jgi:hypothetical protein
VKTPKKTMKNDTTPGPWHIWHEHPANVGHVEPSGYNLWQFVPIATPCGMIRLLAEGDTLNRREANARLIAAAPETAAERDRLREEVRELREVLGASLAWIERHRPKGKIGDIFTELNEMENGIVKPARAVLAKTNPKA